MSVLGTWVNKSTCDLVKRLLPAQKPMLMDLGCGIREVWTIKWVKERGIKVVKSDLSNEKVPVPSNYFTVVTAFDVIEHLINPDNMLREAYRILKDNGILIIETPNLASYISRIYLLLGYQPPDVEVRWRLKLALSGFIKASLLVPMVTSGLLL